MVYSEKDKENIILNLRDAACSEREIEEIMKAIAEDDKASVEKIVEQHRKELLNQFHKSKQCIDCIDYFTYKFQKA